MAQSGSAARRYAEAVHDLALAENAVDAYRASLDSVALAFAPQTLRALRDPSVPMQQRLAAIEAATVEQPRSIRSLLAILAGRDRLPLLGAIARAFGDLVDKRAGIAKAKITTAIELDQEQQHAFVERLERASGTKISATFAVDERLIGGAKVQIGDHLLDTSVRARLDALRTQLVS